MMEKKILIITATLGNRETLNRTIMSVNDIGKNDVFHVIVCPESVVSSLKARYPFSEIISEPEGAGGIYTALNHAIRTYGHHYEYMAFINDDDYWLPDFRILINYIIHHRNIDFVYGKTRYMNSCNRCIGIQPSSYQFHSFISLLKGGIILLTQQATIMKTKIFFSMGGFDESYKLVADTKLWADLSLKKINYRYMDRVCAAYTIQENQLSSDKRLQDAETKRMLKDLPDISLFSICFNKTIYRLINIPTYIHRLYNYKTYKILK